MRSRRVVGALVCAVLVAACGVRDQSQPTKISAEDVPFGLVEQGGDDEAGAVAPTTMSLYFLGREGLVEFERPVTGAVSPARALRTLLAGPLASERADGAASALVSDTARLDGVRGSVAQVALTSGFLDSATGNQHDALAEIVFTLTALPGVDEVSFSVDGQLVAVPRPDGSLVEGPVGRDDYAGALESVQP